MKRTVNYQSTHQPTIASIIKCVSKKNKQALATLNSSHVSMHIYIYIICQNLPIIVHPHEIERLFLGSSRRINHHGVGAGTLPRVICLSMKCPVGSTKKVIRNHEQHGATKVLSTRIHVISKLGYVIAKIVQRMEVSRQKRMTCVEHSYETFETFRIPPLYWCNKDIILVV